MFGESGLYSNIQDPQHKQVVERLTQSSNWDSDNFKNVLLTLAKIGNRARIPSMNRPESVHLQKLRGHFDKLITMTKDTGNEHAAPLIVDIGSDSLVVGRITRGNGTEVWVDMTLQPGREVYQKVVGTIHTHPPEFTAHGFSGQDYKGFLQDPDQQVMFIGYGEASRIMVLKTSVTPQLSSEGIARRIGEAEEDYLRDVSTNPILKVVEFNKAVCTEFGLVMYIADERSNDMFKKVQVVN